MNIFAFCLLLLTQYTWAYHDENFPENYDSNMMLPEDYALSDQEELFEPVEKRSNIIPRYEHQRSSKEPDPRPTRGAKMLRSDYFVRFGRSKQDFLRFGRDPTQQRYSRSRDFLRFGRNIPETDHERIKREEPLEPDIKRHSNYVRFGRNGNFLRFGRNKEHNIQGIHHVELDPENLKLPRKLYHIYESPLLSFFTHLELEAPERRKSDV